MEPSITRNTCANVLKVQNTCVARTQRLRERIPRKDGIMGRSQNIHGLVRTAARFSASFRNLKQECTSQKKIFFLDGNNSNMQNTGWISAPLTRQFVQYTTQLFGTAFFVRLLAFSVLQPYWLYGYLSIFPTNHTIFASTHLYTLSPLLRRLSFLE